MRFVLLILSLFFASPLARAATIEANSIPGTGTLITVAGDIESGDDRKFVNVALPFDNAVVAFHSNGGNLIAGIEIGKAIRLKRFRTLVADGAQCASACALAWLGGTERNFTANAKVGFHAASVGPDHQVTSAGNALIGQYLNQLNLSSDAIVYITQTAPNSIQWLSVADANRFGIEVRFVTLDTPPPSGPKPPPQGPKPPPVVSAGSLVRPEAFLKAYYAASDVGVDALAAFYGDSVQYFGKTVSRAQVLREKAAYFQRWPKRSFTLLPSLLQAPCSDGVCTIKGVMRYAVESEARGKRTSGSTTFEFVVRVIDGRPIVVGEGGEIIARD